MVLRSPTVRLNNGRLMPLMGLGTWKLDQEVVEKAVKTALQCGYRHIDCASDYENETFVGNALKYGIERMGIKREDLWITSKLWNDDHQLKDVRPRCLKTMKDLQLDYLDLYLMHFPCASNKGPEVVPAVWETYLEMEKLVQEGLVKSIGVSNFSFKKIQDLLEHVNVVPAVNQVELHPLLRQDPLLVFCKERGIHVTAYAPLGTPDSASLLDRKSAPELLNHPFVTEIALKLGKTNAQVLLRWALQRETSVIPKSANEHRIQSNFRVFDWELTKEDFDKLSSFEVQYRFLDVTFLLQPEGPYRTISEFWDDPEEDLRMEKYVKTLYAFDITCPKAEIQPGKNNLFKRRFWMALGLSIPFVGLSISSMPRNKVKETVLNAIRGGYRHIDCNQALENEDEVGEALDMIFAEGIVKREDLWITSKLSPSNHGGERVPASVFATLEKLKVKQLDLLCIFFPYTGIVGPEVIPSIEETWQAMEKLVEDGYVRSIGLCNFSIPKMEQILRFAKIKPAVCQIEAHPYFRNDRILQWCRENGIHVTNHTTFGDHEFPFEDDQNKIKSLWDDPVLEHIAQTTGNTKGQVLMRYSIQKGISAVHKSLQPNALQEYLNVFDWTLSEIEFSKLDALQPQIRVLDGKQFVHPDGPYTNISRIWDE